MLVKINHGASLTFYPFDLHIFLGFANGKVKPRSLFWLLSHRALPTVEWSNKRGLDPTCRLCGLNHLSTAYGLVVKSLLLINRPK